MSRSKGGKRLLESERRFDTYGTEYASDGSIVLPAPLPPVRPHTNRAIADLLLGMRVQAEEGIAGAEGGPEEEGGEGRPAQSRGEGPLVSEEGERERKARQERNQLRAYEGGWRVKLWTRGRESRGTDLGRRAAG